jgi:type I restriction enzyme S subunit
MMREYKKYDEYKGSGIDYLKTTPKNWTKMKIKYIAKNNLESFIDGDWIESPYIQDEGIRLIQTGNIGNGRYIEKGDRYISEETFIKLGCTEIFSNDILICRLAEPVGRACLAPQLNNRMITSVDVCRLIPKDNYIKKFIIYYMQMYKYLDYIESLARGSTRQRISRSQLGEVYITIPSKKEQQKIASFLDQKTAEIDEIINKKETLIDHLKKYKKSVITEAVTKGKLGDKYINEDGELVDEIDMKDSGVDWIGEIPEYWEVSKIKYICKKIKTGSTPSTSKEKYFEGNINWITPGDFKNNFIIKNSERKLSKIAIKEGEAPYFKNITLIIGIGATTGKVSHVYMNTSFNQQVTGLITNKRLLIQYYFSLSLSNFKETLRNIALYTTLPIINNETLSNFIIPYPNKKIQIKITNFINQKFSEINNLIQKTKESIEKYKEYKKSLIFEAVTGKIDLRDYELEGGEELAEHNNSSETERECLSAVD